MLGSPTPLGDGNPRFCMDLLYFIILVSTLIFVHELGHFMFAKAFGVKVLTFSLGFGPKVLRLRGRETEYCISLLPLGGYVKMLEASKSDYVPPEDRQRTFESLPLYKRLIVVLAGPVMNLVFPVILYFSVFVTAGPFLPPTVGVVLPGYPADGKLKPGDRVMAVNGREIGTFDELKRIVAKHPEQTVTFKVFRDNKHIDVEMVAKDTVRRLQLDIVEHVGEVGIQPRAPAPVIGVPSPDSPAYRAGLRTFDVVTHVAGREVERFMDLDRAFVDNREVTVPVTYLRPVSVEGALDVEGADSGGLVNMAVYESGVVALTPAPDGATLLERVGIESADLYVAHVPKDTYLDEVGLSPGARILTLDGVKLPAWSVFHQMLDANKDASHTIEYLAARDGRKTAGRFIIRREDFTNENGQKSRRYVLPCGSWADRVAKGLQNCPSGSAQQWLPLASEERVEHPTPIRYAFEKAIEETVDVTRFVMISMVRLAQGRISFSTLSGPITIYELAGEAGRRGVDYFIWVTALISINLGLLNLLPIPVLDGGHVMFFILEGVMRRPLPMRVREVAHIMGMAVLLVFIVIAFKNDVERKWEAITGQVDELLG
ncbi:MAG TPA: RIP metalloprotease RseP [Polyangiaceae bacterium]